jgi:hypothetical protein
MKRLIAMGIVGFVSVAAQGCGGDAGMVVEAAVASFADLKREADEDYGRGAGRALTELPYSKGPRGAINAGAERIMAIDHHRQAINMLRERGEISGEEEDRRINQLFAAYELLKSGQKSRPAFEREAEVLTRP